jgi:hypothetical protein
VDSRVHLVAVRLPHASRRELITEPAGSTNPSDAESDQPPSSPCISLNIRPKRNNRRGSLPSMGMSNRMSREMDAR